MKFAKIIFAKGFGNFLELFGSILVSPKISDIGFGSHGHAPKSENREYDGFPFFPKIIVKHITPR